MAHEPVHIDFEHFLADPTQVFDRVQRSGRPMLVDRDGETYRLEQESTRDLWQDYDPQLARQGLHAAIGALDGVDVGELVADLRTQRSQDSHGRPA